MPGRISSPPPPDPSRGPPKTRVLRIAQGDQHTWEKLTNFDPNTQYISADLTTVRYRNNLFDRIIVTLFKSFYDKKGVALSIKGLVGRCYQIDGTKTAEAHLAPLSAPKDSKRESERLTDPESSPEYQALKEVMKLASQTVGSDTAINDAEKLFKSVDKIRKKFFSSEVKSDKEVLQSPAEKRKSEMQLTDDEVTAMLSTCDPRVKEHVQGILRCTPLKHLSREQDLLSLKKLVRDKMIETFSQDIAKWNKAILEDIKKSFGGKIPDTLTESVNHYVEAIKNQVTASFHKKIGASDKTLNFDYDELNLCSIEDMLRFSFDTETYGRLKTNITDYLGKKERHDEKIKSLEATLSELKEDIHSTENSIKEIDTAVSKLDSAQKALLAFKTNLQALSAELEKLEATPSKKSLENQLERKIESLVELGTRLFDSIIPEEKSILEDAIKETKTTIERLQKQISSFIEDDYVTVLARIESIQNQLASADQKQVPMEDAVKREEDAVSLLMKNNNYGKLTTTLNSLKLELDDVGIQLIQIRNETIPFSSYYS